MRSLSEVGEGVQLSGPNGGQTSIPIMVPTYMRNFRELDVLNHLACLSADCLGDHRLKNLDLLRVICTARVQPLFPRIRARYFREVCGRFAGLWFLKVYLSDEAETERMAGAGCVLHEMQEFKSVQLHRGTSDSFWTLRDAVPVGGTDMAAGGTG
ncbi:hypothetical protein BC835DRAFT_475251 [Cytidiella melzeri]|nr:hypothetical protein BC835DRAFT_475251 [Cytidiella melzeri]